MIDLSSPIVIAIAALLLLVFAVVLIWRVRSDRTITKPPAAPPEQQTRQPFQDRPQMDMPSVSDIIPERVDEEGFSSQLQTASYNIRIEAIEDRNRFVVNGITYNSLEEIPDRELRNITEKLLAKTVLGEDLWQREPETLRQVLIGNQKTIEARNPSHTISVQKEANQTRYVVDGLTYYNLKDIPDPEMGRKARELEQKML
jgi:hypothetical protein